MPELPLNLDLLIADGFAVRSHRRFHRKIRQNLQQMILNHVAHRAGLIVKCPAPVNPEIFRHRDLHALNVISIPKRFKECVGKVEINDVVDRPLAQIMVNPENRGFGKAS